MSTHYIEEAERLCDTVTIMSHGSAVAVGAPGDLVPSTPAARRSRSTARPRGSPRSRPRRRGAGSARAAPAPASRCSASTAQRQRARRRAPADQPRGRLRPAHRRGDLDGAVRHRPRRAAASAASSGPRSPACSCGRSSTSRSYWRSTTFSSTVEPTLYLLAFGFGFGSLVSQVGGYRLRRLRRHRHGGHRGAVLERLPGHVRDVREVQVPAHVRRDPRRAGRHRGDRHRRGAVDRPRAGSTAACRCSWPSGSASTRPGACCSCPFIAFIAGFGWASFGIAAAGFAKSIENFNYIV